MTSSLVPDRDDVPSLPSRIVTIDANTMLEVRPDDDRDLWVDFTLTCDLHVPADDKIVMAGTERVHLDRGQGSIRLPAYTDAATTVDGSNEWGIVVRKSWSTGCRHGRGCGCSAPYVIRVPEGTTTMSLADLPAVKELTMRERIWRITGASATVSQGAQWDLETSINGGVIDFDWTVPPGGTAWDHGLLGSHHLDDLLESGAYTRQGSFHTSLGYPVDGSGLVNIVFTRSTPTGYAIMLAIVIIGNEQQIYTRRKFNGTWYAWVPHTFKAPLMGGQNLDEIMTSGTHPRQGGFYTSLGYPVDGSGVATVIHTQTTPSRDGYASQLAYTSDFESGEQGIYTRSKNLGTWTPWVQHSGGTSGGGPGYAMAGVEADGEWTSLSDEIALLQQLGQHREAEYFEVGRSVQNRVIPAVRVGFATEEDGSPRPTVLVTAGVHGNERATREGALRLIRELIQATTVERYKLGIIVIPNANPDGISAWTRNNANGVNLNRDFIEATQPETQAVRALVERENIIGAVDLHGGGSGLRVNFVEPDPTRHTIKPAVMERSHRMFDAVWEYVLDNDEVPWRYPFTDGSDGNGLVGTYHNGIAADYDVPSLLLELPFISLIDRDDRMLPPRVWMAYATAMFVHGAIDVIYRERQAFQAVTRGQSYTIPERHRGQLEQARAASVDSGDIDITSSLTGIESGSVILTRIGQQVWLDFQDVEITAPGSFAEWDGAIPAGHRPPRTVDLPMQGRTSTDTAGPVRVSSAGQVIVYRPAGTVRGLVSWLTR